MLSTTVLKGWQRWRGPLAVSLAATTWLGNAIAADAPGAPGAGSAWTTGAKQGLGTSIIPASKLWYTFGQSIPHEVYSPQLDTPDVQDLQFIVADDSSFVDLERDAADHHVELVDPSALIYRQLNTAKFSKYRIIKTAEYRQRLVAEQVRAMKITIETSGGFAPLPGMSRPITIDTATIDPQLARELESLVQDAAFFARPAFIDTTAKGAADYRTYTITVQDGPRVHTVRLTDPITDSSLERLVSRLQVIARPSKP